jgi:hypothetical protein
VALVGAIDESIVDRARIRGEAETHATKASVIVAQARGSLEESSHARGSGIGY